VHQQEAAAQGASRGLAVSLLCGFGGCWFGLVGCWFALVGAAWLDWYLIVSAWLDWHLYCLPGWIGVCTICLPACPSWLLSGLLVCPLPRDCRCRALLPAFACTFFLPSSLTPQLASSATVPLISPHPCSSWRHPQQGGAVGGWRL
jgi:hypothetical protein